MATRSGSIDPEIVLHLLRTRKLELEEVETALEREAGLLGLSGVSARVEELERSDDPAAQLALSVFCYRVACAVAAMAAALGGLDAVVFTGGVGEHSERVRDEVCGRLAFLGGFRIEVVEAREDVVAARAARDLLANGPAPPTGEQRATARRTR